MIDRRTLLGGLACVSVAAMTDTATGARRTFFQRLGLPIGLQVYTLGSDAGKDPDKTFADIAAIGYREVELPVLLGRSAGEIAAAAKRSGVAITGVHLPLATLTGPGLSLASPTADVAEALATLGARTVTVPIMLFPAGFRPAAGETFQAAIARAMAAEGADIWKRTAALLNRNASALKPLGIALNYHNHNLEFAPIGDTTGWEILVRETDPRLVGFEVDTGWIAAAGLDPTAFLDRHQGRVKQLHVKDVATGNTPNFALSMKPTEVGSGTLDWARILPAAHRAGCRHFYVEQEPPFTMPRIDAARRSHDYLAQLVA
jgi:sugar phosphate isomerase/epimerase